MKFGIVLSGSDAKGFVQMAIDAEAAGWDGVFLADAISIHHQGQTFPAFDPWTLLGALAVRTERIRLGTLLTPLPRRRPWKLARETMTLDHLSNGRAILATGLGAAEDDGGFCRVGEAMELKARAARLEEGLEILRGCWSGQPFSFSGQHYQVTDLALVPPPVQTPRIPIWCVGVWPKEKSMQRALRCDGLIPQKYGAQAPAEAVLSPTDFQQLAADVAAQRSTTEPFDLIIGGNTSGNTRQQILEKVKPYAEAGATWWIEEEWTDSAKRIQAGPPRWE